MSAGAHLDELRRRWSEEMQQISRDIAGIEAQTARVEAYIAKFPIAAVIPEHLSKLRSMIHKTEILIAKIHYLLDMAAITDIDVMNEITRLRRRNEALELRTNNLKECLAIMLEEHEVLSEAVGPLWYLLKIPDYVN